MRYVVELYDKDNDFYAEVLETDDKQVAETTCNAIALLFCNKDIIIRRNDRTWDNLEQKYKDEPFDWVEVYDRKQGEYLKLGVKAND